MAYFIISKFALSYFLRFRDNWVFLKIAERRGAIHIRIRSRESRIRARRARIRIRARGTASKTDTETLRGLGIRVKIVGKTHGRTAAYLRGHTA